VNERKYLRPTVLIARHHFEFDHSGLSIAEGCCRELVSTLPVNANQGLDGVIYELFSGERTDVSKRRIAVKR